MSQATFEISGMSCGHCVKAVDTALSQAEGVIDRQVAIGSATGDFDAARIDIAKIAQGIDDAGYPVTATR